MKQTCAILAVLLLLAGCDDERAALPSAQAAVSDPLAVTATPDLAAQLELGEPRLAQVREMLRVPGRIEVDETRIARIGSPVAGRVTELGVTVGQEVRRGQVLAQINSTELSGAQLAFLKALSQRQLAERAAARAKQLFDADVIGAVELQRRQSELDQAEAEVGAARDQLKVLGMPEAAIRSLADARAIHSASQLVTTLSGTVIERNVTDGQVVQPADSVFVVADLSRVWVIADVPEQNAGFVRVGEQVAAEIPALPGRAVEGRLTFVSPTVNPETRTVRVRMELDNAARDFKPAMLATVLIKGREKQQMVVPMAAVVREENRDYVYVHGGNGAFRMRPVHLGGEHDGSRVVLDGLRAGERIVMDGAFHLNNERRRRALEGA